MYNLDSYQHATNVNKNGIQFKTKNMGANIEHVLGKAKNNVNIFRLWNASPAKIAHFWC